MERIKNGVSPACGWAIKRTIIDYAKQIAAIKSDDTECLLYLVGSNQGFKDFDKEEKLTIEVNSYEISRHYFRFQWNFIPGLRPG